MDGLLAAGAALYAAGWEARRRAYAVGLFRPRGVQARVVSVGNLTVGGTGKTTLTLHLARLGLESGRDVAVVCRRYRPGPTGEGDEERLYRSALGPERVFAGSNKCSLATAAATAGHQLLLVDDGFSHWPLARDLDLVLLDRDDPWGGGRLLPRGRLREPRRALQRAGVVVISRLGPREDPAPFLAEAKRYAPGAWLAAGCHRITGLKGLDGIPRDPGGTALVVTATGNPEAVRQSAREAGFEGVGLSAYRDHHWFSAAEAERELERARRAGATLILSRKDATRWPTAAHDPRVAILEVKWEWRTGGAEVEARVMGERE